MPDFEAFQHRFGRVGRMLQSDKPGAAVVHFVGCEEDATALSKACDFFSTPDRRLAMEDLDAASATAQVRGGGGGGGGGGASCA